MADLPFDVPLDLPVAFNDVLQAAERLRGIAHHTPVHTSRSVNERVGASVHFKCENLQRVGAFKFRGAYNAISRNSSRGILTYSSGNHAQAVALSSRLLDRTAVIVMPSDAPAVKLAATRAYLQGTGGEVVIYQRGGESRESIGSRLATERSLEVIPPYDHPHIIAGQGTAALELFDEVGPLDVLYVPCGGGGLLSGTALVAQHLCPNCRVIGVEPEAADDATRSFRTGVLHTVTDPVTIADGARTPSLGSLTFPMVKALVSDMTTVSDEQLIEAMNFVRRRMKLVIEPTAALGLAALFAAPHAEHERIGVIFSGGNVD